MNGADQRRQWSEHLEDEARALELQQQSAGETHSPLAGPLPHSADQLADAVAAAVAAERQRCAELADSWSTEARLQAAFGDFTAGELRAAAAAARAVGRAIRNASPHGG